MYSMTGFGRGVYRKDGLEITVELKSVNNRFLDIAVKCPHVFFGTEEMVRAALRDHFSRGRIDVFLALSDARERVQIFSVDEGTARAYAAAAERLKEAVPSAKDDFSLTFLLRQPEVVRQEECGELDEEMIEGMKAALSDAIAALKDMRRKEGERLKQDVLGKMDAIENLRDGIAARAPSVSEEYRKKLTERMTEFLGGKVDESRILTEAAIFADKCSIDEELTRLSSHIAEFRKIAENDTVGRKLDFLIQEFNRECNTVCSKASDAQITALALEMKNEIEKVREQIQNLE